MERVRGRGLEAGMLLAIILAFTGTAAAQDPGDGFAALADADFFAARRALAPAADDGDPAAQYALALLLGRGIGGDVEPAPAYRYLSDAALHPFRQAQVALGICYREGRGVLRDDLRAADLFARAARVGDRNGVIQLGRCFAGGLGRKQDGVEAFAWFLTAAKSGSREAAALLGRVILEFELTEEQKRAGEKRQQEIIAEIEKAMAEYEAGKHVTFDFDLDAAIDAAADRAFELYERRDYDASYRIYLDLADSVPGHAASMFFVARMHERGWGREQDYGRAVEWYRRSALAGERAAYENLAWLCDDGRGVTRDRKLASSLFEAAAYRGWWSAQTEAARRLAAGVGYDAFDPVLAWAFLTIAIQEGQREEAIEFAKQLEDGGRVTEEQRRAGVELAGKILTDIGAGRFPPPPAKLVEGFGPAPAGERKLRVPFQGGNR